MAFIFVFFRRLIFLFYVVLDGLREQLVFAVLFGFRASLGAWRHLVAQPVASGGRVTQDPVFFFFFFLMLS